MIVDNAPNLFELSEHACIFLWNDVYLPWLSIPTLFSEAHRAWAVRRGRSRVDDEVGTVVVLLALID